MLFYRKTTFPKSMWSVLKLLMPRYSGRNSTALFRWLCNDIRPCNPGEKGLKRIGWHIRSRDNGMRIMRWKIGPTSAQTDRKNVLPAFEAGRLAGVFDIVSDEGQYHDGRRWNNFCVENVTAKLIRSRWKKNINDARIADESRDEKHEGEVRSFLKR